MSCAQRPLWSLSLQIGLRYLSAARSGGYFSFLSLFSIAAMALGVAALVIVTSVMNGFERELEGRLLRLLPEVTVVHDQGYSAQQAERMARQLAQLPGVNSAYPQVVGAVMVATSSQQHGGFLRSLTINEDAAALLSSTTIEQLQTPFTVVVGRQLARQLGVRFGDTITVTLPRFATTPFGLFPRSRRLTVVGTFSLGTQLDSSTMLISPQTADQLFSGQSLERQIAIELSDDLSAEQFIRRHGGWQAEQPLLAGSQWRPWQSEFGSFFAAVALEKRVVASLLFMIVVVAGFNIVATLSLSVLAKRKEIAVLRTVGLQRHQIVAVFLVQGLLLGGIGILAGLVCGLPIAYWLPDIAYFFEQLSRAELLDPSVYMINALPSQIELSDIVITALGALFLSFTAALVPAWRAGSILPSEALRYDR